ncbi:MAG TPA: SRPBCC domain-containing protein [Fibrobacteria bacterium]|jgi:uncharacterized protein YndB with AHSA1/START domain|nr:SRPBCC domain-containing protein [Fibrobacteria bacterium]
MSAGNDHIIISRRVFTATREAMWEAFRNPKALARWWGPSGFTNVFHAFEFRHGGTWDFTMTGPDGNGYRMQKHFVEIDPPARLVFDHPDATHGFRMFIELAERDEGAEMSWRMAFDSAEEAGRVRNIVVAANEQNFDRLADYLSEART